LTFDKLSINGRERDLRVRIDLPSRSVE
jgi:hypothetical protein